jgi:DNA mismatch repair protein MutS
MVTLLESELIGKKDYLFLKNNSKTPLMIQYDEIKSNYSDSILLFRMGDFYETFSADAVLVSELLGIVLTKRSNGKAADVDLAGFPYHSLDNYLPKLVKGGHKVAICEQIEDPSQVKGIVKRKVIEVVTPGTITSEQILDQKKNNFIACIIKQKSEVGISIIDTSTGEFYTGECHLIELSELLSKYNPSEVVIPKSDVFNTEDWYLRLHPHVTSIDNWTFNYDNSYRELIDHFNVKSLKGFGVENFLLGIISAGGLFTHLKNNLSLSVSHLKKISPIQNIGIMGLDGFTVRNLEIFNSLSSQNGKGTLISSVDYTLTAGGGRLLVQWIKRPLAVKSKIEDRLEIVETFFCENFLLKELRINLKKTLDVERIIAKICRRSGTPRELVGLSNTLDIYDKSLEIFQNFKHLSAYTIKYKKLIDLKTEINKTLKEDPPASIKKGNVIKSGIDYQLDDYRDILNNGKSWIAKFQQDERQRLGISSLKVSFNRVFGYYIEITKTHQDKVPDAYIRKQTLVNSERYITENLKIYEEKVLNAESNIYELENKIFQKLVDFVSTEVLKIQNNAAIFNDIDVLSSFAYLAILKNYTRPNINEKSVLKIINGRHPVIEDLLPATQKFIANDLSMDIKTSQIHLITGPNMAGKSTFLRQTGIIVLLAQIGSYVPAESAEVGIVDKLFTRVGASDNLAGGESTFLVEMNEAANILNNATERSLILFDEVGRGTATFDGLSIAWAIVEYLHEDDSINARTLFATHYHELSVLEDKLKRLQNFHVEVKEYDDKIIFLRKIIRGSGDKSYGIQVAKMAGLPPSVVSRAKEILIHKFDKNDQLIDNLVRDNEGFSKHLDLDRDVLKMKNEIEALDLNQITPIEALSILNDIKKKYN